MGEVQEKHDAYNTALKKACGSELDADWQAAWASFDAWATAWDKKHATQEKPMNIQQKIEEKSHLLAALEHPDRSFKSVEDVVRAQRRIAEVRAELRAALSYWDCPAVDFKVGDFVKCAWGGIGTVVSINKDVIVLEDIDGFKAHVDRVDIIKKMDARPQK